VRPASDRGVVGLGARDPGNPFQFTRGFQKTRWKSCLENVLPGKRASQTPGRKWLTRLALVAEEGEPP
jgi:hypothetical protein